VGLTPEGQRGNGSGSFRRVSRSADWHEARQTRRSIVAVVFRFLLVLRINVIAQEFLDREGLIQGFLAAHLALALVAGEEPSPERASLPLV
jgi:hypothetical protein